MSAGVAARTPQTALAVLAVIAAPVLVGQATTPGSGQEASKPEAVKLIVGVDRAEKRSASTARLLLEAKGPAPTEAAMLTGDGGLTVVRARTASSAAECNGLEARLVSGTGGATPWCLELTGLSDGVQVVGTLSGANSAVELTVSRRNPYFGWPLLCALAGLVVGAAVVLIPRWLRKGIRKATLDKTLDDNEQAAPSRKIVGLREWVTERRVAGESDDALLPIVTGTMRRAPAIAARARRDLARAANRSRELLGDHRALTTADTEAKRTDHLRHEFVDDDGEPVAHPAKALTALLGTLEDAKRSLGVASAAVGGLPAGGSRDDAQKAFDEAMGAYEVANKATEAAAVEDAVAKLERAIATAQGQVRAAEGAPPSIAITGATTRRVVVDPPIDARDDVTAATADSPTPAVSGTRITALIALTTVVAVGVTAWALASLWLTIYEPKDAFGGIDYAALLVGAVGSGAAGAILTLVSAWDPLSPAETD